MAIRQLPGSSIVANSISTTQLQTTIVNTIEQGGGPRVSSLVYPGNDTAGNTVGGQTVYIVGSGFETNNAIYINGNAVPSKSFISASNLSFTTPALSAGIYPVYVINTDSGATAIFVPGYISSAEPTWVTSAGSLSGDQDELSAWSYSLSATGDDPITYALAAGSSLPSGVSLASNGVISGTISSPSGNTTTYTFSVVATDAQNQDSTRQFTVTTSTGEGVLFANNVLLIHADETNNKNNHHIIDSSNNSFAITRYGNATQGSYSPFSQTGWSGYFDGSGDSLTVPLSTNLAFGTGDFTIECWIYFNSVSIANQGFYSMIDDTNDAWAGVRFNANSSTFQVVSYSGGALEHTISHQTALQANKWHHCAVTRSGTTMRIFLDGVVGSTTATTSTNYGQSGSTIGSAYPGAAPFAGYISNLRVIKGTAQYTATFTVPSTPLAPIANTQLLTLQSNRLIDEGPNNFAITRNGDVSVQAFSPFAPGLLSSNSHSVYFDGTGDYLSTSSDAAFSPGTGDFTIECWAYLTATTSEGTLFYINVTNGINLFLSISSNWGIARAGVAVDNNFGTPPSFNTWNHLAVSRSGSTIKAFINGTQVFSGTNTSNYAQGAALIGSSNSFGTVTGYISNFRFVKGTALYTSNFTPSTSPLTAVSNTSLLTCQSATLIDNSTNAFTITRNGDAAPRKFNPFGQTFNSNVAYSTANVGGSGYFDGTGDYLTAPYNSAISFGSEANWTIEFWFYTNNTSSVGTFIWGSNGVYAPIAIVIDSGVLYADLSTTGSAWAWSGSTAVTAGQWYHIAIVRNGATTTGYRNGTSFYSASSVNLWDNSQALGIGARNNGTNPMKAGYMTGLRLVKGTAVYTANFTPPTAPPTNIANTSLLCNFTNAGIFDQTAKNVLETVGDAKVSTAQYKYGTASMYFDGTGDYLVTQSSALNALGSGDFTIEMWLYPSNTNSAYRAIIASDAYAATTNGWTVYQNGTSIEMYYSSGGSTPNIFTATSALTSSVWQHFALVRSSGTLKAYVNGTQVASVSNSINFVGDKIFIGDNNAGDYFFNGYIDDLRITRGYARYTSNFTPPTSALKDK